MLPCVTMQQRAGIYKITNKLTGDFYIGSAVNLYMRKADHLTRLKGQYHHSQYMQRVYNKYGVDNLLFETIAYCPQEYLIKLEQWFLDNLKPKYNTCKIAGSTLGFKLSAEVKRQMTITRTGKVRKMESIEKTAAKNKKPIIQLDMNGNPIQEWESCIDAATKLTINKAHITGCCKGRVNSIGGFKWKYKTA